MWQAESWWLARSCHEARFCDTGRGGWLTRADPRGSGWRGSRPLRGAGTRVLGVAHDRPGYDFSKLRLLTFLTARTPQPGATQALTLPAVTQIPSDFWKTMVLMGGDRDLNKQTKSNTSPPRGQSFSLAKDAFPMKSDPLGLCEEMRGQRKGDGCETLQSDA